MIMNTIDQTPTHNYTDIADALRRVIVIYNFTYLPLVKSIIIIAICIILCLVLFTF